jgi:hypothetical protein
MVRLSGRLKMNAWLSLGLLGEDFGCGLGLVFGFFL